MVFIYKKRREKLRQKFGVSKMCPFRYPMPAEYGESTKAINYKISRWNKQIRKLKSLEGTLNNLELAVVGFTGVKINKQKGYKVSEEVKLAKSLYYKYGLENGISPIELMSYIWMTNREESTKYRTRFTQSFSTTPENKQTWLEFKKYYETNYPS